MIYNIEKDRTPTNLDCMHCKYYDRKKKQCSGLGVVCYDKTITGALIDPKTKLIVNLKEKKENGKRNN